MLFETLPPPGIDCLGVAQPLDLTVPFGVCHGGHTLRRNDDGDKNLALSAPSYVRDWLARVDSAPMDDVILTGFDYVHEFRHNGEPLARVRSDGAVEVFQDVPLAEPRFWLGLRAWRRHHRPRRRIRCPEIPYYA